MGGVVAVEHQKLLEEAARVADLARELQDSASAFFSRVSAEEQSLRSRAAALDSDLRRIHSSLRGIPLDSDAADKLNEGLGRARNLIRDGDVASVFPTRPTGGFLRAFLGPINVHATRKDVRLKVKEEYNNHRAHRMDVVWGETAAVEGQLLLLCPILFTLQGFEAYVGFLLLQTASNGATSEWQGLVCGTLLILMAFGNFIFTIETLVAKSRFKAKMKRSKSKKEMEH